VDVAGAMFMISLANIVLSMQTDVVIVGSLLGTTAAGHYSIASQMSWIAIFGVMAVLSMASPMFAELHAQGRGADLQRLVQLASRMTTIVALPAVLVMIIGGRFILGLFGESFVGAYPVLIVLCLAQLVGALWGGVAGFMMTMTGHQKQAAIIVGVSAVGYMILAFVLTPAFGAVGTATATVVTYTGRSVAMWLYIKRTTGINVLPFGSAGPVVHTVA
jgi:O-antigen/teichoic acid export membrane protein